MLVKLLSQSVEFLLTIIEYLVALVDPLLELLVLSDFAVPEPVDLEEHMKAELVHLVLLALEKFFKRIHVVLQHFFGICCLNQPQQMH